MSPIKGLTDNLAPAFPRLGKLRKGAVRPESGRAPGKELEYFRFTSENPAIEAAFREAYGQQPRELDVYLPFASIDDNFSTWKELWVAGGLKHRCDGETCTIHLLDDGTYSKRPIPCPGGCKEVGRLSVILPALFRAGFVGYVTMETHAINDIAAIMAALLATSEARGTEDMRGIGFCLRRVLKEISTPAEGGKRARRRKWMVELVPAAKWIMAQLEASQAQAMGGYLPAPRDDEQVEADEDIADAEWEDIEDDELVVVTAQQPPSSGNVHNALSESDAEPPAWQGQFFGWLKQAAEKQGLEMMDDLYGTLKNLGHMKPHLAEYDKLYEAQKAAMDGMKALVASGGPA